MPRLRGGRIKASLAMLSVVASLVLGACGDDKETVTPQSAGFQPVTFDSTDGLQLSGRLFGQGGQGVILAHMFPADQESWREFAVELAQHSYLVLTFDFRGYGDSEGAKEIDRIDRDVEGALNFLEHRGVDDVFLIGASMGGTASLKVASRRSVSGVVSLSSPVSFQGLDAAPDVPNIEEPVLFIASEQDGPAHGSMLILADLAQASTQTLALPGTAHGTDILNGAFGQSARDAIMDFLEGN